MDGKKIAFGRTDGFRYIGIAETLTPEECDLLANTPGVPHYYRDVTPERGLPHSEVQFERTAFGDFDAQVHQIGESIAETLRRAGTVVEVDPTIQALSDGGTLFELP